jgi:hypothetical protein
MAVNFTFDHELEEFEDEENVAGKLFHLFARTHLQPLEITWCSKHIRRLLSLLPLCTSVLMDEKILN